MNFQLKYVPYHQGKGTLRKGILPCCSEHSSRAAAVVFLVICQSEYKGYLTDCSVEPKYIHATDIGEDLIWSLTINIFQYFFSMYCPCVLIIFCYLDLKITHL